MKEIEITLYKGKKSFTEWHGVLDLRQAEEAKMIAFLNQTDELKKLINVCGDNYTVLSINNWAQLCFLYENTLIDYKVLEVDFKTNYKDKIVEGQQIIDRLFKHLEFDTTIRDLSFEFFNL